MSESDRAPRAGGVRLAWEPPPLAVLRAVAADLAVARGYGLPGEEHSLDVYTHPNPLLRGFFALRLRLLVGVMERLRAGGRIGLDEVVDLGGGSGILAASIAPACGEVRLVDLSCAAARGLLARRPAPNVVLEEGDALARARRGRASAVVAADVLEHFADLGPILGAIEGWLAPGGVLVTSLPTENAWYRALRIAFGKRKPHDHHHGAAAVEAAIRARGFRRIARVCHPLGVPLAPLFSISAWAAPPGAGANGLRPAAPGA